jgi:uncharacterized protein YegP (UPF0339 family)
MNWFSTFTKYVGKSSMSGFPSGSGGGATTFPVVTSNLAPEPMPPVEVLMPPTMVITEPKPATTKVTEEVFEVLCDSGGRFRFHLKGPNRQIIAVSQSYLSKQSPQNGIESVKKNAPMPGSLIKPPR